MNIDLDLMAFKEMLRIKKDAGKTFIFDQIRRKWLILQPEEVVRQLVVHFLTQERGYSPQRISIERQLTVNKLKKRCDILVFDRQMNPELLVECKAPGLTIGQAAFRQIAWYNLPLRVPYLLVTNGRSTYCCRMNYREESYEFLDQVPAAGGN